MMFKSVRVILEGQVTGMAERINAYKFLARKHEGKREHLEDLCGNEKIILKSIIKK
jgi:hypothetical protein